jgi:condensin complex subunit 1
VNTIYLLGEQPDLLCSGIIKNLTTKVFFKAEASVSSTERAVAEEDEAEAMLTEDGVTDQATQSTQATSMSRSSSQASVKASDEAGAFALAQLVFVVGHVAIKHIVYLELVEREFKRRKDESAKCECILFGFIRWIRLMTVVKAAGKPADKDGNDLDAVAGNAEDDIGELITGIREKELLFGDKSLLAVYGPMVAHICATPKRYKVGVDQQIASLGYSIVTLAYRIPADVPSLHRCGRQQRSA